MKNSLIRFQNITAGDMSTATITSVVTNIKYSDNVGIELDWTGTSPVGVAAIQTSISYQQDAEGNVVTTGTWNTITSAPVTGNSGSLLFDLNQIAPMWIRVVYTKTSGVGTLNGYICAKAV